YPIQPGAISSAHSRAVSGEISPPFNAVPAASISLAIRRTRKLTLRNVARTKACLSLFASLSSELLEPPRPTGIPSPPTGRTVAGFLFSVIAAILQIWRVCALHFCFRILEKHH